MGTTTLGTPNITAIIFFFVFIAATLGITGWAARRTKTTSEFFAAGSKITGFQNGLALAGDFMSAASFLGIAGLVTLSGFDGLIYSVGWLVGWPSVKTSRFTSGTSTTVSASSPTPFALNGAAASFRSMARPPGARQSATWSSLLHLRSLMPLRSSTTCRSWCL